MNSRALLPAFGAKRLIVVLFDVATAVVCALILLPAFARPAYAYVDPSVMTYTIQALAGVAVALSAVAGVAFRRSRKAIMKTLNIDENAKKESDAPWVRIEPAEDNCSKKFNDVVNGIDGGKLSDAKPNEKRGTNNLPLLGRALLASLASLFVFMTLLVMAPFEIIAGASGDLQFRLVDVWWIMVLFALAASAVTTLVLVAIPKRFFTIALSVVFAFGLCCYIQAMFLNADLPQADGRPIDWWGDHAAAMVTSTVVWVVVLTTAIVAAVKKDGLFRAVAAIASGALIIVQCVGVVSLFSNDDIWSSEGKAPVVITETGLYQVSGKENVIVIILDFYDTMTLERVASENPGMLDELEGFTWYQDSAGVMIPTGFALPYLMTGEAPAKDQAVDDYLVSRWTEGTFLKELKATDYSVGLYTTTFGLEYLTKDQIQSNIYNYTDNARPLSNMRASMLGTVKALSKAALYRDMPWPLKSLFRFYTDDINQHVVAIAEGQSPDETPYIMDDSRFLERLKRFGLSVDKGDSEGAFRMIHLSGDHNPYTINERGEYVGEGATSKDQQAVGAMYIASYYLSELKRLGVYDNSTIIITADHGDWAPSMDLPTMATSPILLYKPAHAPAEPAKVSSAPMSHSDYFGTILEAMGQDYAKYGTKYSDYAEGDKRERAFFYITHDQSALVHSLLGYVIKGDANDFSNWFFTGDVWPCDFYNR